MIKTLMLAAIASLSGCQACGYESQQNDMVGQVKKVVSRTPLICPNYVEVDISMGVMRGNVGSLSKEDVLLFLRNPSDAEALKAAADAGDIVQVTYNVYRASNCTPDHELTAFQIIK